MGTDKCKEKDMKEKFSKEYLQQLRLTLRSKLNETNHKMTVNTWAISIMRYSARIEIEELERKVIGSNSVTVEEARSVEALPDLIREDMSNVEEEVPIVMESFFFLIGIHSVQGWTATTSYGITRKEAQKRLKETENLFRKNLQLEHVS